MAIEQPASVFVADGDYFVPTGLSRGPWDENAQHGGAPAALLAHVAETVVDDPAFCLARLTFELTRPVPIAPLKVQVESGRGRSVRRLNFVIEHDGAPVARATALLLREAPLDVPEAADVQLEPGPEEAQGRYGASGLSRGESFGSQAMDVRVARGSSGEPGPGAAWFRLRVPLIDDAPTTPAMRAMAAADFGNGISWILPAKDFLFANTDLTVYLHRPPVGEWIGLDSETIVQPSGVGLASSTLYDVQGRIGMAHQNLLIRQR